MLTLFIQLDNTRGMRNAKYSFFGFQVKDVTEATGFTAMTVYRHIKGQRKICPGCAIKYHDALGIPLEQIRPDIWRPTNESSAS